MYFQVGLLEAYVRWFSKTLWNKCIQYAEDSFQRSKAKWRPYCYMCIGRYFCSCWGVFACRPTWPWRTLRPGSTTWISSTIRGRRDRAACRRVSKRHELYIIALQTSIVTHRSNKNKKKIRFACFPSWKNCILGVVYELQIYFLFYFMTNFWKYLSNEKIHNCEAFIGMGDDLAQVHMFYRLVVRIM